MNHENENRKTALIEKEGLAVEIHNGVQNGLAFSGALAPESVISLNELIDAVDAVRLSMWKYNISDFSIMADFHTEEACLSLFFDISRKCPARNALLSAVMEYLYENPVCSDETFSLIGRLSKALGKPVKTTADCTVRITRSPFALDKEKTYTLSEFEKLIEKKRAILSDVLFSSFTVHVDLECVADGFIAFTRDFDITVGREQLPSVIDLAIADAERQRVNCIEVPDEGVEFALFNLRLQKAVLGWLNTVDDGKGDPAVDRMCEEVRKTFAEVTQRSIR